MDIGRSGQSPEPERYVILPDSIPLDTLLVDDAKRLPKVAGWTSKGAGRERLLKTLNPKALNPEPL